MQDYNTIIGVIQLRQNDCSFSVIEARYHIGSGTVQRITLDELKAMEPHLVEDLIYPPQNLLRKDIPMPDFQHYYDRIHAKGSKVNISYCWIEYKQEHPDGYEQSQFYEYYNRFVEKTMVCAVLPEFPAVIEKQKNKEHWMYSITASAPFVPLFC